MSYQDDNESILTKVIIDELNRLSVEIGKDIQERSQLRKFLKQIVITFDKAENEKLLQLIEKHKISQLIALYPHAKSTFDKLHVDAQRKSSEIYEKLSKRVIEYANQANIPLQGRPPRLSLNHLLDIDIDSRRRIAKIGAILIKRPDWGKMHQAIDKEYTRIWQRPFKAGSFRDELLSIYNDILVLKPNPSGWVRLADVYQLMKRHIKDTRPNWKKEGRLVALYKDEFSADLTNLWDAQVNNRIGAPHIEFSGIRDPRLSFKVVLPGGREELYGHLRPRIEVRNE